MLESGQKKSFTDGTTLKKIPIEDKTVIAELG